MPEPVKVLRIQITIGEYTDIEYKAALSVGALRTMTQQPFYAVIEDLRSINRIVIAAETSDKRDETLKHTLLDHFLGWFK